MALSDSGMAVKGFPPKGETGLSKRGDAPVHLLRAGNEDITIGENSVLEGSFETQGAMFVDGAAINADLHATQLSIGATGRVEGQATVLRAEIAGAFDGSLECSGEVILRSSSRIGGELKCTKLVTHRGAVIDAQVRIIADDGSGEERSPREMAFIQATKGPVRPWTRRRVRKAVPVISGAILSLGLVAIGAFIF